MSNKVKIVDNLSQTVLFECMFDEIETAYIKAQEYEDMGLDISIKAPGLAESLVRSLGATEEELNQYTLSTIDEIDEHNDLGCAICLDDHSPAIKQ